MDEGNYTIYNDHSINVRIEADLQIIMRNLLELFGANKLEAILLVGGFGRSEGGVFIAGNEIQPVNDYDLLLVVKGSFYQSNLFFRKRLGELAKRIAAEIGIKQVDVGITSKAVLRKSENTIYNYELLAGHQLLWGNLELHDLMPSLSKQNIPLLEGTRLMVNRGGGLLIAGRYFSSDGVVPKDKKINFAIECQKALMAMGDCELLLKGLYDCSYKERLKNAKGLLAQDEHLFLRDYVKALESKIQPSREELLEYDVKDWFEILEKYDLFYRYFEMERLGKQFNDWIDYTDLIGSGNRLTLKEFAKKIYSTSLSQMYQLKNKGSLSEIFLKTLPLLLFSFKQNDVDHNLLRETENTFLELPKGNNNSLHLWEHQVDQYLSLWHP